MVETAPALGYYWGDDEFALETAAERLAARMEQAAGSPVERWRRRGDATTNGELLERVGTAPFFGGGTLVIVSGPTGLARGASEKPSLAEVVASVAPGNGLAFLDAMDGQGRRAAIEPLVRAVTTAGGETREFKSPREDQMARWVEERAAERSVRLGRGAARELAARVGAYVRENDVDRRLQGRLAVSELDKLALYRPGGEIAVEDIRRLVPEAVPGSIWALQDAIAVRNVAEATRLAERLIEATPLPVLLTVIHRRIRELIAAGDLVETGASPADIVRVLKVKPYPAEKLSRQARNWTLDELESAFEGLLELDVAVKGADGVDVSDGQVRLLLTLWLADHVAPQGKRR